MRAHAGVYFEKFVKGKQGQTLWIRNLQLSIYGVPLSMAYAYLKDGRWCAWSHSFCMMDRQCLAGRVFCTHLFCTTLAHADCAGIGESMLGGSKFHVLLRRVVGAGGMMQGFNWLAWAVVALQVSWP